jgi:NADH:ubiquinone oxidoreductase subunit 5 (subunit L)/multisubunit Na+/H+ antiporter MnhA subunit
LTAGAIAYATGTRKISGLGGIARALPIETAAFFIGAFTVTGVPPFGCFWSKFMIFTGAMGVPGPVGPIILVLALSESVISFAWFLRIGQKVFFGPPSKLVGKDLTDGDFKSPSITIGNDEKPGEALPTGAGVKDPPPAIDWVLIVLMICCLAAPLIGIPIVNALALP